MKADSFVAMPFVSLLDRKPRSNDKVGCSCGWQIFLALLGAPYIYIYIYIYVCDISSLRVNM